MTDNQNDSDDILTVDEKIKYRVSYIQSLEKRIKELTSTFQHMHVNNGKNDGCKQCGLDLRDEIHTRSALKL